MIFHSLDPDTVVCIVAAGENGNDLNYFGLYLNKSVMVIIIKIYDRDRFL
jgi:hypothetical protein